MANKNYYFLNLGCPKNRVDGDYIRGRLNKLGIRESASPEEAGYIIINTCAFIEEARQETRGEIKELIPFKKNGTRILATGCYPALYDLKKEIPEVDAAFGLQDTDSFFRYIAGDGAGCSALSPQDRIIESLPYAYVKISDGCDNRCSYCTIPLIRGGYRSISPELILKEVQYLALNGVKEAVLVGQDTAVYGKDLDGLYDLPRLCRMISEIDGIEWIRVLYAHPAHLDEKMLDRLFAVEKVGRYLDLPIQHISDKILSRMNRKCNSQKIRQIIGQLRRIDKDISIRTTLMVGFPGETDDDFKELIDFVEMIRFDYLGVFAYSPEQHTTAVQFEKTIDPDLVLERREFLYDLADRISTEKARAQICKRQRLLIETISAESSNLADARSYRQAPEIDGFYKVPITGGCRIGDLVEAKITKIDFAEVEQRREAI